MHTGDVARRGRGPRSDSEGCYLLLVTVTPWKGHEAYWSEKLPEMDSVARIIRPVGSQSHAHTLRHRLNHTRCVSKGAFDGLLDRHPWNDAVQGLSSSFCPEEGGEARSKPTSPDRCPVSLLLALAVAKLYVLRFGSLGDGLLPFQTCSALLSLLILSPFFKAFVELGCHLETLACPPVLGSQGYFPPDPLCLFSHSFSLLLR